MGRHIGRRKLGSRNYKNYSQEMLNVAVDLVKKNIISSVEAEKRFHIPRRTIENKVKGLHMKPPGSQLRLSEAEEKDIVNVLIAAADFGSPLSRLDLRILIFEYLNKNHRLELFSGKMPGKWWVRHFLSRNKNALTERVVQNIKKSRAEKTVEEFQHYFNNLARTLKDIPKENILNYDETNLSDNPGSSKCIFRRKVKYPERIINHSKGNISIMFSACADGYLLPVYTVYKAENLWSAWCIGGPPEARFNRTKSGWFDGAVFEDWFKNIVIPWAAKLDGPKVVIGDNLSSHLNVDIIELCEQHNIRFAFLPTNSTHITQPLDVAYFGPLKKVWRKILTDYKVKNPSEALINKCHFPILLKKLLEGIEISNKENIKAGFKATGIVPFNPDKVLKKLPDYEEEMKYKIDTVLLDFLKSTKSPNPLKRTVANRKLKVEPGTSISSQDAEKLMAKKQQTKTNQQKTEGNRVTILSDVQLSPENQAYIDVRQCSSLDLKKIDAKTKLPLRKKETKNIDPYANPMPSTSGICREIKRKTPNTKQLPTKKRKVDSDSDEASDDDYSLRDTTDEESIKSEDEDIALQTILKNSTKYEADYYINEAIFNIDYIENCVEIETINNIKLKENKYTNEHDTKRLILNVTETKKRTDTKDLKKEQIKIQGNSDELNKTEIIPLDNHEIEIHEMSDNENIISKKDKINMYENIDDQNVKECMCETETNETEMKNENIIKDTTDNTEIDKDENTDSKHEKNEHANSEICNNRFEHIFFEKESVLIRYYIRNNWKYYVGFIDKIDKHETETYYSIIFLKTIRKPQLKFVVCKRDRDVVPSSSIVKNIKLHQLKQNLEYVIDDCDKHYF